MSGPPIEVNDLRIIFIVIIKTLTRVIENTVPTVVV